MPLALWGSCLSLLDQIVRLSLAKFPHVAIERTTGCFFAGLAREEVFLVLNKTLRGNALRGFPLDIKP